MITFLMVIDNLETRNKLEDLYIKYHKEMYIIAMDILHNTHDSQDVIQTSIIKLAKYIDKIEDVECNKTKNLIVTIIKSTAIDVYRKKQKDAFVQLEQIQDYIIDENESIDELIIRIGDAKFLSEKLAKINETYADILTLKYYYGFDDIQIAELLNISNENVRIRLYRAKKAIKKLILEDEYVDYDQRKCAYE